MLTRGSVSPGDVGRKEIGNLHYTQAFLERFFLLSRAAQTSPKDRDQFKLELLAGYSLVRERDTMFHYVNKFQIAQLHHN